MKAFIQILFIVTFAVQVFAQQKQIDSLEILLSNHIESDSLRLTILDELGYQYSLSNGEKGLKVAEEQFKLATFLRDKKGIAGSYINKGRNHFALSQDSLALKCFQKAFQINESSSYRNGMGLSLYGIARIEQNRSEFNEAIATYQKAYNLYKSAKNTEKMAGMQNGIGICQMYSSNYPKALESFMACLRMYEGLGMSKTFYYGNILSNIGIVYGKMEGKLNLAASNQEQAISIFRLNGYKVGEANALSNLANVYDNMQQPLKAIELHKQSLNIQKEIGDKIGIANALTNIGIAYTDIDYQQTVEYLKQTLPIYQELGNKNNEAIVLSYLGEAYLTLSQTKDHLDQAEVYLTNARAMAKEIGNIDSQIDVEDLLAELYSKKRDFKKAFDHKLIASTLKDSLQSQDLKDEITRLEVKYEYDKKEADVKAEHDKKQAVAQAEIKRQKTIKNGSILGGGLLLAFAGFGLFIYKRKRDAVSEKKEAEFRATVADTELKALRAQMNPHFIFNSLNSIGDYMSTNRTIEAKNYLTKFAKLMRETLENSTHKEIFLQDDLQLLELYMQMEALRLNNKFTYEILVDKSIDAENTLVPPMILQPFVENSIWHGIAKSSIKGLISIHIHRKDHMLVCTVDDNGIGFQNEASENKSTKKLSLGHEITKNRIEILNKTTNTNGSVDLINKPNGRGVKVEIKLPLAIAF